MNRADKRKFHVIYKTTCLITQRFYIGMHSTDNLDDGYLGSGKILWHSIRKYGKDKHRRENLEFLSNRKLLADRERAILTEEFRCDPLCMNLKGGGIGNLPGAALTEDTKAKMSVSLKAMWSKLKESGYTHPQQSADRIANRVAKNTGQKRNEAQLATIKQAQQKLGRERFNNPINVQKRLEKAIAKGPTKTWTLINEFGLVLEVKNLMLFCKENNIDKFDLYRTRHTNRFVSGYTIAIGKS